MQRKTLSFLAIIVLALLTQSTIAQDQAEKSTSSAGEPVNLSSEEFTQIFEQQSSARSQYDFQADVSRLMDIIINSLYTNKEIFLRQVISNASDALNKIRYKSISDPSILGDHKDLEIRIDFDKDQKTISITDTGIGMTKNELIKNLGTVANSGTTNFIEAMGKGGGEFNQLIGQFGVGFYSVYLVANKVVVTSKHNDDDQYIWTSTAGSKFQIAKDPRGNTLGRGTRVTIYLKQDAIEMIEQDKVKNLVKRYSEYIDFPIYVYVMNTKSKQVPADQEEETTKEQTEPVEEGEKQEGEAKEQDKEKQDKEDQNKEKQGEEKQQKDDEVTEEEEAEGTEQKENEPKMKTVTQQVWEWEVTNNVKAIWLRPKDQIKQEQYKSFYKAISNDYQEPVSYKHFTAEGEVEFRSLLYIPSHAPYDMFENYYGKSAALKLYVRRVLITEEFEELLPRYLNFVKGVLDSDDLPLNVSREQLQQLKLLKVISKKLVRKTIDMIRDLAAEDSKLDEDQIQEKEEDEEQEEQEQKEKDKEQEEQEEKSEAKDEKEQDKDSDDKEEPPKEKKFDKFYKAFSKNIKLGIIEDTVNRNKLADLLRFYSTKSGEKQISLKEYIKGMKQNAENIYFITGEDRKQMIRSPLIQRFIKEETEVLLLDDPIDEYCMQHLAEYQKKKLQSAAKKGVDFNDDALTKKKQAKLAKMYEPLTTWMKQVIGKDAEKVEISNRLIDVPSVIVSSQYGYSAQMEKVSRAQAFANAQKTPSHQLSRKHLELNPYHPAIKKLLDQVVEAKDAGKEPDDETKRQAMLIWNMSIVNSGFMIDQAQDFTQQVQRLLNYKLGLSPDEQNVEIDIDLDDDEEEENADKDDENSSEEKTEGENADSGDVEDSQDNANDSEDSGKDSEGESKQGENTDL